MLLLVSWIINHFSIIKRIHHDIVNFFSEFKIVDKEKKYKYRIHLCKQTEYDDIAVEQREIGKTGLPYYVGFFNKSHVFGGSKCVKITVWKNFVIRVTSVNFTVNIFGLGRKGLYIDTPPPLISAVLRGRRNALFEIDL